MQTTGSLMNVNTSLFPAIKMQFKFPAFFVFPSLLDFSCSQALINYVYGVSRML